MQRGPVKAVKEEVGLTDDLLAAIEKTTIAVLYSSPAHDLLVQGDTISGVKTRQRNSYVDYYGQVILACGGLKPTQLCGRNILVEVRSSFSICITVTRLSLNIGWDLVRVRGTRFNTGTMLRKALLAGAQPYGHWSKRMLFRPLEVHLSYVSKVLTQSVSLV